MRTCKHCNNPITSKHAKIFCGSSCAASYNNKGVRRHGEPPNCCLHCGKQTRDSRSIFCSQKCQAIYRFQKYDTPEEKYEALKLKNRLGNAKYRAKLNENTARYGKVSILEKTKIKIFYENCPHNHEVDHIWPIDKGGPHRIWNLQYLPISDNRKKSNKMLSKFKLLRVLIHARLVKWYNS